MFCCLNTANIYFLSKDSSPWKSKKLLLNENHVFLIEFLFSSDMQDFSQLSSRTVTEVLMLEMKMSPAAKTYLVSGYPRSMRDVVEYSEKVSYSFKFCFCKL
jgi:hypothetical protein